MPSILRKSAATVATLVAFGLGGAAIAGAAGDSTSSGTSSSGTDSSQARPARAQRQALSSELAARVKAAALAKVPGATVLRTESGGPYDSPFHAHIETSDGTRQVVLVDSGFDATGVQAEQARGASGRGGHGGRGGGETPLTGATKQKVEAAVLAEYSGATIVRTETNGDSSAPYESHITTSAGAELEVLVSEEVKVVEAREQRARP